MDLKGCQLVWRTNLLLRRSARERRLRLSREIAAYVTPADRAELFAAVERCQSPGREEIRGLLARSAPRSPAECTPLHLRT